MLKTDGYKCSVCGAAGIKLWRQYQTLACDVELMCVDCAHKDQKKNIEDFDLSKGDQIGWMVPAVPVNDTFWGYCSVPQEGVDWWKSLPTKKVSEKEAIAELRERLAELCHEQWSGWMNYLYGECDNTITIFAVNGETQAIIPKESTTRWFRQMNTPYSELSEEEKESDRKEADKFLNLLKEFFNDR